MRELPKPFWIFYKTALFAMLGLLASGLLLHERPTLQTALLLGIAVWSFCRLYYFAFYVIESYVDSSFRYTGLTSLLRFMLQKKSP